MIGYRCDVCEARARTATAALRLDNAARALVTTHAALVKARGGK